MRLRSLLARAAAAAACAAGLTLGGALPSGTAAAAQAAATATPAPTAAVIRFVARTAKPRAGTPWPYCVIVVSKDKIEPLEAAVEQRLFDLRGNPIGDVGSASFYGAWCQSVKLPAAIRNRPITLETRVTVLGRDRYIRTAIRVR